MTHFISQYYSLFLDLFRISHLLSRDDALEDLDMGMRGRARRDTLMKLVIGLEDFEGLVRALFISRPDLESQYLRWEVGADRRASLPG